MFIVLLKYVVPLNRIDEWLEEHRAYLKKYYDLEKFIMSGAQSPRTGGVIVAKASSKDELWSILKEDPFLREGLIEYEVVGFTPSMFHPDLTKLLEA